MHEFDISFDSPILDDLEFAKQKPRPKIRGSQHIRRQEKKIPKKIIRKPIVIKKK